MTRDPESPGPAREVSRAVRATFEPRAHPGRCNSAAALDCGRTANVESQAFQAIPVGRPCDCAPLNNDVTNCYFSAKSERQDCRLERRAAEPGSHIGRGGNRMTKHPTCWCRHAGPEHFLLAALLALSAAVALATTASAALRTEVWINYQHDLSSPSITAYKED